MQGRAWELALALGRESDSAPAPALVLVLGRASPWVQAPAPAQVPALELMPGLELVRLLSQVPAGSYRDRAWQAVPMLVPAGLLAAG